MIKSVGNIVIESVSDMAYKIYESIEKNGIKEIKNMFSSNNILQSRVQVSPEKEYIKRMLISQMNLGEMLLTHKYKDKGYEGIAEYRKQHSMLIDKINGSSILLFDNETIEVLFGNSLEITSVEELEAWKEIIHGSGNMTKDIPTLYREEKNKIEYENEKNKVKKFIQSFRYRKMLAQDTLENSQIKRVREILRNNILSNPESSDGYIITKSMYSCDKGVLEYQSLQELKNIAQITLISLVQPLGNPISIEEVCGTIREMMEASNPSKYKTNYRQKQVTIGSQMGINPGPVIYTIPFKEVPEAIQKLQERYDNAYCNSESEEEYIREITKIYADFVYIQPYEDGNKRTATCLFNSMLLSKGILPPPISLCNDGEKIVKAFNKAHEKDYSMLQDIIIDKYNTMKRTIEEKNNLGILETKPCEQIKEETDR